MAKGQIARIYLPESAELTVADTKPDALESIAREIVGSMGGDHHGYHAVQIIVGSSSGYPALGQSTVAWEKGGC